MECLDFPQPLWIHISDHAEFPALASLCQPVKMFFDGCRWIDPNTTRRIGIADLHKSGLSYEAISKLQVIKSLYPNYQGH